MKFTYIHGTIMIDNDYERSAAYIRSIGEDSIYPFMGTKLFGLGDYTIPHYYHNMLITFGTTYKYFGIDLVDWNLFILKTENILRNIDFESAQFHIESAIGNYIFHWVNKKSKLNDAYWLDNYRSEPYKLIETNEFFFGFGDRGLHVPYPDDRYSKELDELSFEGFNYPIKFAEEAYQKVREFNKIARNFHIGSSVNFKESVGVKIDDRIFEILYDLKLKGIYDIKSSISEEIEIRKHVKL